MTHHPADLIDEPLLAVPAAVVHTLCIDGAARVHYVLGYGARSGLPYVLHQGRLRCVESVGKGHEVSVWPIVVGSKSSGPGSGFNIRSLDEAPFFTWGGDESPSYYTDDDDDVAIGRR